MMKVYSDNAHIATIKLLSNDLAPKIFSNPENFNPLQKITDKIQNSVMQLSELNYTILLQKLG